MHITHDENYGPGMMKIMDQLSGVFSSLSFGLRSPKVCVTRRPWIETSAKLCIFGVLFLCFILTLFITTDIDHG